MPHTSEELRYLSRAQVEELRSNLTMLDVFRARKVSTDRAEVGIRAYYEVAKRTGLIPSSTELEDFLVRVRTADFNEVMEAPNSPEPVNSGESSPASSATTGSDLETSSI